MRYLLALGTAGIMSLMLFALMHYLISGRPQPLLGAADKSAITFIRLQHDTDESLKKRTLPKKPELPQKPPQPQKPKITNTQPPAPALAMSAPKSTMNKLIGGPFAGTVGNMSTDAGISSGDEEVMPLVRVAPRYPRKAAMRGIEGWVKVEFTILEDGTVADAKVIDAQPRSIFNREAVRAVLRWKFKPKIVDGKQVRRQATQIISFKLDK
jgi:protein TonB